MPTSKNSQPTNNYKPKQTLETIPELEAFNSAKNINLKSSNNSTNKINSYVKKPRGRFSAGIA